MPPEIRRQSRTTGKFERTACYLPPELKTAARRAAQDAGITLSAWLATLAARELDLPQFDATRPAQE